MYNNYRDPYNKYGPNRAYDNDMGYTSEPRGRNDNVRRSGKRSDDRRVSSRHATHVPYVQDERYEGPGRDRDPAFNTRMSEPRDDFNDSTAYDDKRGKRPVVVVVVFCLLLLLVLGALAIGGVALYYAHFDTPTDTYLAKMIIQDNSVATGITLSTDSSFPKMETKICKGVKAVFGGELKSCTLDTLQKVGEVRVEGRLRFHRDKLQAAATDAGSDASRNYIEGRLTYACSTELICEGIHVNPVPRRASFELIGNFSTASPKVGMRNDSNHYAAQKSVCDTIKNQLGSLYVNCYVRVFETGGGTTTISVEVDTNGLLDEVKKDATAMKTLAFSDSFRSLRKITLTKLINKDGPKLDFFKNFVLKVA